MENWLRYFITFAALFSGTIMPMVKFPLVGQIFNMFWGVVFGLFLNVAQTFFGAFSWQSSIPLNFVIYIIGLLVWPAFVCVLVYKLTSLIPNLDSNIARTLGYGLLASSFLVVVPGHVASSPPVSHIYVWFKYVTD